MKKITIGWKVSTTNPALASLRYRALLPLLALEESGVKSKIISNAGCGHSSLAKLDVLIIVKSFTIEDYYLAQQAKDLNVPVIFDLCDNIFIEDYVGKRKLVPADVFFLIASIANAITVSTDALAEVIRGKIDKDTSIYVIPDGIEKKESISLAQRHLFVPKLKEVQKLIVNKSGIIRLKRNLGMLLTSGTINGISQYFVKCSAILFGKRHKEISRNLVEKKSQSFSSREKYQLIGGKRKEQIEHLVRKISNKSFRPKTILWFGNHGASHAKFGMLDLLSIKKSLEKIASELSVELIVVSNNFEKYKKYISCFKIPSRYYEWNIEKMEQYFHQADVVVIPNSLDSFSICKSANRTVLALSNSVPVVATATPALEALRECIILDDFEDGLRRYLTDAKLAKQHVKRGKQQIEQLYGQKAINNLWQKVIDDVLDGRKTHKSSSSHDPEIIIAVHLPQDIALVRPIIEECLNQSLSCAVWTNLSAIKRWPFLLSGIRNLGVSWKILLDDFNESEGNLFPDSIYAFLSASETNLNPHRFTHKLTKIANSQGLYTATMQHGYENVGLTYHDDVHDITRVHFASRHIYIWGGLDTLHPKISNETRKKCISVGCPKPKNVEAMVLPNYFSKRKIIIGIFENLHWHRYSDEYRDFFLEGVSYIASLFPAIVFLVKPHNAGMWLTVRHQGKKPELNNIIIADPQDQQWANISAEQLFAHLAAVITTPSTVALDAARLGLPVALVNQGLDLNNYSPLPLIQTIKDWKGFVSQVVNSHEDHFLHYFKQVISIRNKFSLGEKSHQFINRVLFPGEDAASRIINDIKASQVSFKQENKHVA